MDKLLADRLVSLALGTLSQVLHSIVRAAKFFGNQPITLMCPGIINI
jgi:hypothetical protein